MEADFVIATLFNLGVSLGYTILALIIGMGALTIIDKKLLKHIDIEQELKNNNMAVSVFASTILIFVAIIVSFGLKGWIHCEVSLYADLYGRGDGVRV